MVAFVRLTTVEMQVLRQQLTAVFSSLRYDENLGPMIRRNLSIDLLNDGIDDTVEWITVKDYPEYYKMKIRMLNQALDECVLHHFTTIK